MTRISNQWPSGEIPPRLAVHFPTAGASGTHLEVTIEKTRQL
jgi:hypothetical protein